MILSLLKNYTKTFALRFLLQDEYNRLKCKNKAIKKQIWLAPGRAEYPISLLHFLKPSDEILLVDVGAHIGDFAQNFRDVFPNTTVIAFEPAKDSFEALRQKYSHDTTVTLYPYAISNSERRAPIYLQGTLSQGNSLEFHPAGAYGSYDNKHDQHDDVQCYTLDSFAIENDNKKLCLKIDVEGHDIEVFEGATELLKKTDVLIVETNFINMNLDESGHRKPPSFSKICTLCEAADLYPIIFHTFGDHISNYAFRRDVIFVKKHLLDNVLFI